MLFDIHAQYTTSTCTPRGYSFAPEHNVYEHAMHTGLTNDQLYITIILAHGVLVGEGAKCRATHTLFYLVVTCITLHCQMPMHLTQLCHQTISFLQFTMGVAP